MSERVTRDVLVAYVSPLPSFLTFQKIYDLVLLSKLSFTLIIQFREKNTQEHVKIVHFTKYIRLL